ncbi:hypothetical protein FJR45_02045 [Sulfurimonas sediminis]|uniref:HMA domain-containing protein n=1 Tax=Sulfurimonas sediminis TaxID=2590020 RepID=A0A7M1AZJ5_9BACT|nr:cation transporter [Sulfurimonas sediminis]QOP42795.1 hypothetical protein FJR45_02045 [Sulfurimonas sediminis]
MKDLSQLLLLLFFALTFTVGCSDEKKETKVVTVKKSDIVLKTIGVNGMTCMGCEVTLEGAVSKIEGVVKVKASAKNNQAAVEFDKTKTDEESIRKSIIESGYEVN